MRDCACLTCHGFYAATLDVARVEEMVRLHPRGLLAVRTGAVSGTVVIDVDTAGLPAMRQMIADGLLPRTLAQRTGNGYHLGLLGALSWPHGEVGHFRLHRLWGRAGTARHRRDRPAG
jgi:hypothetical protein